MDCAANTPRRIEPDPDAARKGKRRWRASQQKPVELSPFRSSLRATTPQLSNCEIVVTVLFSTADNADGIKSLQPELCAERYIPYKRLVLAEQVQFYLILEYFWSCRKMH
jgi:hypothetical protein